MKIFLFSEQLKNDMKECFLEEDGIFLSKDETQEYLETYADFFLAFARADCQAGACAPGGRPAEQDGSDRGVSNTSGTL